MHFKKIWVIVFSIKIFYLFFAFFVFAKLTSLGDTHSYFNNGIVLSPRILYSSSELMFFTGALFKKIFILDVFASIPCLLLSFYGIYYAIDRLNLYKYPLLLILALSLPNFGVWTSIHSKEAVGCFFAGIISVTTIQFLNGNFKIKLIDILALYLCLIFKPQYLLFILQALVYLKLCYWLKLNPIYCFVLGLLMVFINLSVIYFLKDLIDQLATGMYVHFNYSDESLAQSTRTGEAWLEQYGFLKEAPYGMFISFWGPTLSEMLSKPTHLISGIESLILCLIFLVLLTRRLSYVINALSFNPKLFFTLFIIFFGILFVHYPFGYLNPGSAIRYRENFLLLFLVLGFYLFDYKRVNLFLKK